MERKGRENHGLVSHSLYTKWKMAKNRCFNKKGVQYHDYGGRGIIMCDEWSYNFKAFYDYMMALPNAMKPGYSIDRIENDGNYEPGNMRWCTFHVQTANRRPNKGRKYRGVYKCQNKYKGKLYGIKYSAAINVNRTYIYLGLFPTEIEAAKARDQYIIDNNLYEYPLNLN